MSELGAAPSITIEDIRAAQKRIAGTAMRTPLVPLRIDGGPAEIYLKLENLQPGGSFKLRGAMNAVRSIDRDRLDDGVWTVSSGNMAVAVAWSAHEIGVPCTVVVSDDAAAAKLEAIASLGAEIVKKPFSEVLEIARDQGSHGMPGSFIHPFSDAAVLAGAGTIGVEVLEDLPDVDMILMPYGGGGLSCGVAFAVRALSPKTRLYACEVETAAPLAASLAAGEPVEVENTPSFIGGAIGTPFVFPKMWPLARRLLDGSLVVGLAEVASAIRLLAEKNHVVAEGAGATPVAAALKGEAGEGKVVCVVSGGNIDAGKLAAILNGRVP